MSNNSKRISIARAIMYKELAKRNAERELECKRRGLWALWQHQTRYKTLWHFLRASDERLMMLCDECMVELFDNLKNYSDEFAHFERCYTKNPCKENDANMRRYYDLYLNCLRNYNAISTTQNILKEAINNENKN